ncbi:SpoIIE family protein phosphatase [Aeromicrobium massiliense]|uniref:SpoIIE family protein phosphatase n=1 Tax=Aeromicrobium massiliense TaxID=1464554 RepID=UPI0002D81470|nr:SpoIIE family protein phosphatase [Aeromicrobium massiliense]
MLEQLWKRGPGFADVDWSATPLGPPEQWSTALRQAVDLVVNTEYAATLLWGPEFVLVYNEAYVPILGEKHPWALGRPCAEVFPEAWHLIGEAMQDVLDGKGALYYQDQLVPLVRGGFLQDGYFTYSYSPVHGEDGTVEGVIDIVSEKTREVVALRRLAVLAQLRTQLADVEAVDDLADVVLGVLAQADADLPDVEYRPSATRSTGTRLPATPPRSLRGTDLLLEDTGAGHVAWMPVRSAGVDPGDPPVLVAALSPGLRPDHDFLSFLNLVSTAVTQTRNRLEAREVERRIALSERKLSEALQHSLLTPPTQVEGFRVAVRYRASAEQAEVGGDWYDSFLAGDGALTVTVGDVSGHDRTAAAGMAQARNMLRALAFTMKEPPSRVMAALDEALEGLDLGVMATALLARVEQADDGGWQLSWTNAGSLPPVLVHADGRAELLDPPADLMLGVDPELVRHDHSVPLEPGSSVVLYSDGLIERRDRSLTESIERLTRTLDGRTGLDADQLAEHLLTHVSTSTDDDIALLVLRVDG